MAEGRPQSLAAIWSAFDGKEVPKYAVLGELYAHGHSENTVLKACLAYDRVCNSQPVYVRPGASGHEVRVHVAELYKLSCCGDLRQGAIFTKRR